MCVQKQEPISQPKGRDEAKPHPSSQTTHQARPTRKRGKVHAPVMAITDHPSVKINRHIDTSTRKREETQTHAPMMAIMATRPFLSSFSSNSASCAALFPLEKFSGSCRCHGVASTR